ncbi:hypothetical protein NB724_001320 [Pantoea ananatis]|uniref:hypothetical protein n=1 Tax=Pantoea ananas TaxID=553 RepID=UPI0021F6FC2A|nr:hypothetical protein [Pantoea ananatis]MCW0316169.1 hypothetical protein [Pantoea ananatis]MCW0334310.1 hypothetical protein [Pantoea ananatis]MCW0382722.1 hypothetical protein [Pantoea ananatis]MCW0407386.1 hypothetical protein [Pantoea ananatis]MCW0427326.1 hypothetical protein [Pantoea ananatis]
MSDLILLGAGASSGCLDSTPYKPPLGKDLFTNLMKLNGVAASIDDDIKAIFMTNFEEGMATYYRRSRGNIMRFQRELSEYLSKFEPSHNSNYHKLLSQFDNKSTIYISLNYDVMFESAALSSGYNISYHDDYKDGHVRLLKIHGSSNFWPNTMGVSIKGGDLYDCPTHVDARIITLSPIESSKRFLNDDGFSPAISMFAEGKEVKVSPSFVLHQQSIWAKALKNAKRIFIIGVRVHTADEHIWKAISESDVEVFYFGKNGDEKEFNDWKTDSKKENSKFIEGYFDDAITTLRFLNKKQ